MSENFIKFGKALTIAFWVVALYNEIFYSYAPWEAQFGFKLSLLFWLTLCIHAVECLLMHRSLRELKPDLSKDYALVMLFGIFHFLPLKDRWSIKKGL